MPTIYLVLTQTGTVPSRFFQHITRQPYNHLSLSLDASLTTLCSFARQDLYNPLKAGFVFECVETGVFSLFPETKCQIFELEITSSQFQQLEALIQHFEEQSEKYRYNLLGLIFLWFDIPLFREHHHVCSQFVSYLLESIGVFFPKSYAIFRPTDIYTIVGIRLTYEGRLQTYIQQTRPFHSKFELDCEN